MDQCHGPEREIVKSFSRVDVMNEAFEAVHRGHFPKGPVNLTRPGGETLLMVAVDYAHLAVVDFLLSRGANPLARRWDNVTAADIARSFDPLLTERLVRAVNRFRCEQATLSPRPVLTPITAGGQRSDRS